MKYNPEFPMFLYVLEDPRKPGEIRYIGKTQSLPGRFNSHSKAARDVNDTNHHLAVYVWWRMLLAEGVCPRLRMLWQGWPAEADAAEERAIAGYRALGQPLLNQTDGGQGVKGLRRPAWNRGKRLHYSVWNKGKSTGLPAPNKGKAMPAEQREKLSKLKAGKPWSIARRESHERRKANGTT